MGDDSPIIHSPRRASENSVELDEPDMWYNTPQYYDVYPLDLIRTDNTYTGVKEVQQHDAVTIQDIRYYNIMGQESMTPFDGINIMVIRYKDGSMISRKILK